MQFGDTTIYIPNDSTDTIIASLDHSVQNRPDVVSQIPRICTLLGPSGSGKTALVDHWTHTASRIVRLDEVVRIWLSPPSDEYRSMSHMVLARIFDELERMFAPSYVPVRARHDEADSAERFGKKQLEVLRKNVASKLSQRPIRAIVVGDVQHIDLHALHYLLKQRMGWFQNRLVPKRAIILVGQEKKSVKPDKQLRAWLNRGEAQQHYTEQHQLGYLKNEALKPVIKRLIAEGLGATVPDDDFKVPVNREIGELVQTTEGHWKRLERFIRVLDDAMSPQPDGSPRCITPEALRYVRTVLSA